MAVASPQSAPIMFILTLKVPGKIAADNTFIIFTFIFRRK